MKITGKCCKVITLQLIKINEKKKKKKITGKKSHNALTMLCLFSKSPLFYFYSDTFCVFVNTFKLINIRAFLVAQLVKNPPEMPETWVQSLGWEDPVKKGTATPSSILAWRIPLYSPRHKESDITERSLS